MRRIVQISDLHFGRAPRDRVDALREAIDRSAPDIVVVTGDLTQRAREGQFREARRFLDSIGAPTLVVPGNHDIPLYNWVSRLKAPFARYSRHIGSELEPLYRDEEIVVAGLRTPHPFHVEGGRVTPTSFARLREAFAPQEGNPVRIVASHHPLHLLPAIARPRRAVIAPRLLELNPDILLSGHLHATAARVSLAESEVFHRAFIVVQAGTATSTRQRGEPNAFNELLVDLRSLVVRAWRWRGTGFAPERLASFERVTRGWRPAEAA